MFQVGFLVSNYFAFFFTWEFLQFFFSWRILVDVKYRFVTSIFLITWKPFYSFTASKTSHGKSVFKLFLLQNVMPCFMSTYESFLSVFFFLIFLSQKFGCHHPSYAMLLNLVWGLFNCWSLCIYAQGFYLYLAIRQGCLFNFSWYWLIILFLMIYLHA